jgi:serine/threonine protein kinase
VATVKRLQQHPFAVRLFDVLRTNPNCNNSAVLVMVMERLQPLPEPSELSLNQLFVIAQQLFQALSTLHDQEHIVHGDIKLKNLMMTHDEQGKFTTPYHNSCGDSDAR